MRFASAFSYDVKLQFRHGFYYAYILVSAAYIVLLGVLPNGIRQKVDIALTFSDPSVLGFFFIGGLVLLEKGQNIYDNLFVTPYKPEEYLLSKTLSLTLLSVVTSVVIHLSAFPYSPRIWLFAAGVAMTSVFFTLLGLGFAARCKTLNGFFLLSTVYSAVFMLPILDAIGIWSSPLFYVIPAKASLLLLSAAFEPITAGELFYSIGLLAAWIGLAFLWARYSFRKYIIFRVGGAEGK